MPNQPSTMGQASRSVGSAGLARTVRGRTHEPARAEALPSFSHVRDRRDSRGDGAYAVPARCRAPTAPAGTLSTTPCRGRPCGAEDRQAMDDAVITDAALAARDGDRAAAARVVELTQQQVWRGGGRP